MWLFVYKSPPLVTAASENWAKFLMTLWKNQKAKSKSVCVNSYIYREHLLICLIHAKMQVDHNIRACKRAGLGWWLKDCPMTRIAHGSNLIAALNSAGSIRRVILSHPELSHPPCQWYQYSTCQPCRAVLRMTARQCVWSGLNNES